MLAMRASTDKSKHGLNEENHCLEHSIDKDSGVTANSDLEVLFIEIRGDSFGIIGNSETDESSEELI